MNFMTKNVVLALAFTGALGTAQATSLLINTPTANVDVVGSSFGGTLVAWAITPINNPSYNGTALTAVYSTATGLDFYYQFINDASSNNGVERFSAYDFSSLNASEVSVYQTAAAFDIFSAGTESSDYADRTTFGVIGFSFVPDSFSKVNPGTTSYTQIIRTNATQYTAGNFGLLDGYGDNAVGFAAAVPEPETYALMLAGLGFVSFVARRRLKK